MAFIQGLKKMVGKKDPFASPNETILTSEEKEGVIVFFSMVALIVVITGTLVVLN